MNRDKGRRWPVLLIVLLLAAAFRLVGFADAPPGWRDDELLDVILNQEVADGYLPLYYPEFEGHEPLQHYVVALLYKVMGVNLISHRWLTWMAGMISVALAVPLGRRLFGRPVGVIGAALMAVSFWPVMYARFGLRHTLLLPPALACLYLVLRGLEPTLEKRGRRDWLQAGVSMGISLLVYYAARALPAILVALGLYLVATQRQLLRARLAGLALALVVGVLVAAPMFVAISQIPAGEERIQVVGAPMVALLDGDPGPALNTTAGTWGMFTFVGDPEWLYNLSGRPVFDWLTGALFYLGVAGAIWRWRQPRFAFSLIWLLGGLAPAFVSLPAASFGHTILAQPIVYLLAAYGAVLLVQVLLRRVARPQRLLAAAVCVLIAWNAALTVDAYGIRWNQEFWVRFLYHADVQDIARWLNDEPAVTDLAITSLVTQQQIDDLALDLDLQRPVRARWFDPSNAFLWPAGQGDALVARTGAAGDHALLLEWLDGSSDLYTGPVYGDRPGVTIHLVDRPHFPVEPVARLDHGLTLVAASLETDELGIVARTWWRVEHGLEQPVKQFTHLYSGDELVVVSDRFDVHPLTLEKDDLILQQVRLDAPPGIYEVQVGIYDPEDGQRWSVLETGRDVVSLGRARVAE